MKNVLLSAFFVGFLSSSIAFADTVPISIQCNIEGPINYGSLTFPFSKTHWVLESSSTRECFFRSNTVPKLVLNNIEYVGTDTVSATFPAPTKGCESMWQTDGLRVVRPEMALKSATGFPVTLRLDKGQPDHFESKGSIGNNIRYCTFSAQ